MKKALYTATMILLFCIAQSQPTFDWVKKLNANEPVYSVHTVKTDKNGNVYMTGIFKGAIAFPNGVISINMGNTINPTKRGVFLAKYTSSGSPVWGYLIDSVEVSSNSQNADLIVDSAGNSYAAIWGSYESGKVLSKYNSNGSQVWKKSIIPGPSGQTISIGNPCLAFTRQHDQVILACSIGGGMDADFGNGVVINTGGVVLARYNPLSGDVIQARKTTLVGGVNNIAIADDNSMYIAQEEKFHKFNLNDSVVWSKTINSIIRISGIATDGTNCYVLGNFGSGFMQLDSLVATSNYNSDFFIAKVSTNGNMLFLKAGSTGNSGDANAERIAFDKNKFFYVLGNSSSSVGNPAYSITQPNEHFVLRYDTTGNTIWGSQYNTGLSSSSNSFDWNAFTIANDLSVYVAGPYKPVARFGTDSLMNNFTNRDGFIFKLKQCNIPQPIITQNGNTLSTQTFASYQWLLNDTAINGATNVTYTAIANGNYSVIVADANGCSDTSAVLNVVINGISEPNSSAVNIHPNPATTQFTITTPHNLTGNTLTIHNTIGQQVATHTIPPNHTIPLNQLPKGIYYIQTNYQTTSLKTKLIIQ